MKLKNLDATLFILIALIFLSLGFFVVAQEKSANDNNIFLDSDQDGLTNEEEKSYGTDPKNPDTDDDGYSDGAEVSAGYNPLKKAPGDKLTPEENSSTAKTTLSKQDLENLNVADENLTQKISQKISALAVNGELENGEVTMDDIEEMINPTIDTDDEMPEISEDDILIKKQNYDKLSSEKRQEKMKKDATDYSVAVLYILASNSPEPLTSSNDISSTINKLIKRLTNAFSAGDPSGLEDLSRSGEKITEQLKKVEVPKDLVNIQIKALQYALYAQEMKNLVKTNPEDPIANLANYSKIQSFIESFIGFFDEMQEKFDEYGIEYSEIQDKVEGLGIKISTD